MTTAIASMVPRLESVIGAANVNASPEFCNKYSVDGLVPSVVVKPTSAAEIVEIVKFAASEKLALIPTGSRSKLGIGMPPQRYDLALDMTGLNQISHYDRDDLTLSVDAGLGLSQLAGVLLAQKQCLPLAVPFFERCTIGGTIASGIDSMLRPGYGSARDFLIGAEFVNGAGALTKSGGRVVKNVTGYDLHKLLIGSIGTLAVITRLNFRTFPSPEGSGCVVAAFSSVEGVTRFQTRVAQSYLRPSSFGILEPEIAKSLSELKADGRLTAAKWFTERCWHACVAFEGNEPILRRYSSELVEYAEQSGSVTTKLLDKPAGKLVGFALRENLNRLLSSSPAATIFKINTLPTVPADILNLRIPADTLEIPYSFIASGSGPLYFALQPSTLNEKTIAALASIASSVFQYAASHAGTASILFCPTELKQRWNVWGELPPDAPLMIRVKKAFDPHNIFAPGRFVAGI